MTDNKITYKEKLIKAIEIQNKIADISDDFDSNTKKSFLNYSKICIDQLTDGKESLNLTQLKAMTREILIYWNESIGIDTENFWIELSNANIDFPRRDELRFAIDKGRFRRVDQGMGAKKYWRTIKEMQTVKERFSTNEINLIDTIIDKDEKTRLEILRKCLKKKTIPQTQYLKFGECMAYFGDCGLFDKHFENKEVDELYIIWKNFKAK